MTKTELMEKIAEKTGLSRTDVKKVLDYTLDEIQTCVANGGKVQFPGFGAFETRQRAERVGKNPQTGETMTIPASTVPVFKAGKAFKERVKG